MPRSIGPWSHEAGGPPAGPRPSQAEIRRHYTFVRPCGRRVLSADTPRSSFDESRRRVPRVPRRGDLVGCAGRAGRRFRPDALLQRDREGRPDLRLRRWQELRPVPEGRRDGEVHHAPGLRPERGDGPLRQRGRDQPVQLQARPARRILPEARGEAEVILPVGQGERARVRRLLLVLGSPRPEARRSARLLAAPRLPRVRPRVQRRAVRPPAARDEQQRPARGRGPGALREGRLRDVEVPPPAPGAARDPALAHLRLRGGVLGPAAHREDAGRPLPDRLLARPRPRLQRTDRRERPPLRRSARQRRGQRIGDGPVQDRPAPGALRGQVRPAARGQLQLRPAAGRSGPHDGQGPRGLQERGLPRRGRVSLAGAQVGERPTSRARRSRSGPASRSGISSRRRGASSAASTT